jgi:hypothetical protein
LVLPQLKCASHHYIADTNSMHFKRNNPLVYRVSARCNHGSTGSKQVYLARRRVHNHITTHQLLIYIIMNIITNHFKLKYTYRNIVSNNKLNSLPRFTAEEKIYARLHTSRRLTPHSARSITSFKRVTASRGWIPLHGPAKRNRSWPCGTIRGVFKGHT